MYNSGTERARTIEWSRLPVWVGPAVMLAVVVALEIFARVVIRLPNPGAFVLPAIAFASLSGGLRAGAASAAINVAYTTMLFGGEALRPSGDGLVRWLAVLIGSALIAIMCAGMREAYLTSRERAATAQAAADASRIQLAAAAASLPIAMATLDAAGRVLASVGTELPVLGITADTPPGWSIFDRFAGQTELLQAFRAATEGREATGTIRLGGHTFDARFVPSTTPSGEPIIHAVAIDVTERETSERLARASEQAARAIMERVPLPIAVLRAEDGVFLEVNAALVELNGVPREQLIGTSGVDSVPIVGGAVDALTILRAVQRDGELSGVRLRLRRPDGTIREAVAAFALVEIGGVERIVATAVDVTEQEQAAAIVRSQRDLLARVDSQRESFLALVAHELRTPIASIDLLATALERRRPAAEERSLLASLREQARALTVLTERLLEIGAIEAHVMRLDRTACDLERVARRAISQLGIADRTSVAAPDRSVTVTIDEPRFRDALTNLLSNAVKYSSPGTPIEVAISQTDGATITVVRDRGIGLSPEEAAHLFRKYERPTAARSAGSPGTGLGLYYVRLIAEAHGGRIRAESDGIGQGAAFILELPR